MARLRRSKRIATSAAKIKKQSRELPASRFAMGSGAVNVEAREDQEKSGIYRGTESIKRSTPIEDVLSGLPKLIRRKQKTGRKVLQKREDRAYKPLAEEEPEEEFEPADKGQVSSITDDGLDIQLTTAPKKAKGRKSVRFKDLSPSRLQKVTHRRPQSQYIDVPWSDDIEEDFHFDTSDSDVQDLVAGRSQIKEGSTRDRAEKNEVKHSRRTTRLHRRTDGIE